MSKMYITYWKTKIKKFSVGVRLFEIKYLKTKTVEEILTVMAGVSQKPWMKTKYTIREIYFGHLSDL